MGRLLNKAGSIQIVNEIEIQGLLRRKFWSTHSNCSSLMVLVVSDDYIGCPTLLAYQNVTPYSVNREAYISILIMGLVFVVQNMDFL